MKGTIKLNITDPDGTGRGIEFAMDFDDGRHAGQQPTVGSLTAVFDGVRKLVESAVKP